MLMCGRGRQYNSLIGDPPSVKNWTRRQSCDVNDAEAYFSKVN